LEFPHHALPNSELFRVPGAVKDGEAAPKGATKRSPERSED